MMRCMFAIERAPAPGAAIELLVARTKQVFGEDAGILWDFVPGLRTHNDALAGGR